MRWHLSNRASAKAVKIADRHYSRQKPGTPQFVKPGRCLVLTTEDGSLWVTSWPFAEYVKHAWPGAWECSLFRKDGEGVASELIREAVAATAHHFGAPPTLGLITSIDPNKVLPVIVRGLPTFGYSWTKAGFHYVGRHKSGQLVFQLLPKEMPPPVPCLGAQLLLAGDQS